MKLSALLQHAVFISRGARVDRREQLAPRLDRAGIKAEWFRAIECDQLRGDTRGFSTLGKRSIALGRRFILREAARRRLPHVLVLEDDVLFSPDFARLCATLELPDDWGMFYFGCQHIERPQPISPGIVRVARALDCHAFAVRADYFLDVRKVTRGFGKRARGELFGDVMISRLHSACDRSISTLHKTIPTYAALPNLAWQAKSFSDLMQKDYSNYDDAGRQIWMRENVAGLD